MAVTKSTGLRHMNVVAQNACVGHLWGCDLAGGSDDGHGEEEEGRQEGSL